LCPKRNLVGDGERKRRSATRLLQLVDRALARRLLRAKAKRPRSVPKTTAANVIELDFQHDFRLDRKPFGFHAAVPTARTARGTACERGHASDVLQLLEETGFFRSAESGCESDVVERPVVVVESQQK